MRNLLALAAAVVLGVAGLGWYLGWYQVKTTPTADGHRKIDVDLNTKKISADVSTGVSTGTQKVEQFLNQKGAPQEPSTPAAIAPPKVGAAPVVPSLPAAQSRFRVNDDGSISYTGTISVPMPFGNKETR